MIDDLKKVLSEGSDHYKGGIEPAEFIAANELNFFEGNVIKYIVRHRKKNGAEDLKKARHYVDMLLAYEYGDDASVDSPEVRGFKICSRNRG